MAAVALALLGVLLFLEVIRPFHNLSIDGPLALLSWGIGAALSLATLWLSGRSFILSAASLSVNVIAFTGCFVVLVAGRP
jgi:hypothetical protein